jgi:hypothetical protein
MEKILVIAPREEIGLIATFPFFYKLNNMYPNSEINVIVSEDMKSYYDFLPFKINVYEFPESKNSILGMHHFCVNLHDVFNIDCSFDLISDFKSSFLAFSFRSRKRFGYVTGWNKLWLNEKLIKEPNRDVSVRGLELLNTQEPDLDLSTFEIGPKLKDKNDFETNFELEGAEIIPLFQEKKENFLLVSINNLLHEETKGLWLEFFNLFEDQKIIFVQDEGKNYTKELIPHLTEKNTYLVQPSGDNNVIRELIEKSYTFITNEYWFYLVASTLGKLGFYFTQDASEVAPMCYLRSGNKIIEMDNESMLRVNDGRGNKKEIRVTDEVLDFIHDTIEL